MLHVLCEYIWIDAVGGLRSKNRQLHLDVISISQITLAHIPDWNYDGSSTGQAPTSASEIIIKPVAVYPDPFMPGVPSILVLCDTHDVKGVPHRTNTRFPAKSIFDKYKAQEPWYGIEQEFFIMSRESARPIGFPIHRRQYPEKQGNYYCGVGGENVFGREFVLDVYQKCIKAKLTVSGMNAEVAPGQWEIQIGPVEGIAAADQLYMLRYILKRTSEAYPDIAVEFASKPISGDDWNGSGGHTNFSTKAMREPGGLAVIHEAIRRLEPRHADHIAIYGDDNHLRLNGKCETSSMSKFTSGVGSRSASIRIPTDTDKNGCGYLEDRRPSASCDFYRVTAALLKSVMIPL